MTGQQDLSQLPHPHCHHLQQVTELHSGRLAPVRHSRHLKRASLRVGWRRQMKSQKPRVVLWKMKRPSLAPSTFALDCPYLSEKQVLTKTKRRSLAPPLLELGCQALALKVAL
jgi:hypothetical protein